MPDKGFLPQNSLTSLRLVLWVPAAYILVTGLILAALLFQLRRDAVGAGERLLTSFGQLAEEQTSRIVQTAEQAIRGVQGRMVGMHSTSAADVPAMNAWLRELDAAHPFTSAVWVVDADGQVIYDAGDRTGMNVADRDYFRAYKEKPETGFAVWPPVQSRVTGKWFIPAAAAWHHVDGTFGGVIVVAIDPDYFNRSWMVGDAGQDLTIALFRRDGRLLVRNPLIDDLMGRSFADRPLFARFLPETPAGTLRWLPGLVDGRPLLLSYRTLTASTGLVVVVSQPVEHVLAGWWKTVRLAFIGWIAASAALAAMAFWLRRESIRRQQTEQRYRLLFDANPHAMALHDPSTLKFVAVNDAAVRQYGWSRDEFLDGMTLADVQPPEELPRLQEAVRSGQRFHRLRHWRKDGTRFEVEAIVQSIMIDGRPAVLASAQDVTERNLSRSRLADAIQAFPGSLRLFDRDERLVMSNDVRWDNDQVAVPLPEVGRTFERMARAAADLELDMASIGRREDWLRERLAQFRRGDTDVEVQWRDGRWFQLLERRTSDGGTISLRLDITARKAIEEQLRQSQRMDAIGQLTGGIAHDLNNMLTVIIGNAEALLDLTTLEAEARETLEMMLSAAEGSAGLTNRLLAFARRQPLRPREIDVNEFVGRMEGLLRRSLGEKVEIALVRSDSVWPVSVDPSQLEVAFVNLAINARDAMPGGGCLTIRTSNVVVDATSAQGDRDLTVGDYVVLAISDTGTGMSADTLIRAFEPFFTTKDVGKGTGLGLSMVYGFVQQSGGHVTISSEIDEGTTVRLYLPRVSSGDAPAPALAESRPPPAVQGETILLVEDEDIVRRHVAAQLALLGYRVIQAADGRQAIGVLAGDDSIDLLFTDVVMPGGIGGRELAEQARRLRPGIRTLFTTGYSADAAVRAGRLEFEIPLLSKPYRLGELADRIRGALAGEDAARLDKGEGENR